MCGVSVMVTRDREFRFSMKVLAIQAFMQKKRQPYSLTGANCKCLNSTASLGTSFGGFWQRELLRFMSFLSGPSLGHW